MSSSSLYYDILEHAPNVEYKIHSHGFIKLIDSLPRLVPKGKTADFAVIEAARISYGKKTKKVRDSKGLINYLVKSGHWSPFEMVELKFYVKMPIFVARQWVRHRTANINEYSGRYSEMKNEFYTPILKDLDTPLNNSIEYCNYLEKYHEKCYKDYKYFVEELGIPREKARCILPLSSYTEWYWKSDLKNIFNFLTQRESPHAQKEIRDYANAMHNILKGILPISIGAYEKYEKN